MINMGMNNNENIKKWIDLSSLPRSKSKKSIKWTKSIGCVMDFIYGEQYGKLTILDRISSDKYKVSITARNENIEYTLNTKDILHCKLGGAFVRPLAVTHPELIGYFVNKQDTENYSAHSGAIVSLACPFCGTVKNMAIRTLTELGFGCPACSDGISFPNKFMYNILTQLNIEFINEVNKKHKGFEWAKNYRYDFYIKLPEASVIIEMDGKFHDGGRFCSFEKAHAVDVEKDRLAIENGLDVVRIDCRYSHIGTRMECIKTNILNSKLGEFINFSSVNWDVANEHAVCSNVKLAADAWNAGVLCSKEIGDLLGVSKDTAQGYLKIAADLNMCNYNDTEINRRMKLRIKQNNKKKQTPIMLFKNNEVIGVFSGIIDLDRRSLQLYGEHIDYRNIYAVLAGSRKHTKGYTAKYITTSEYELLLPQFINNTKLY
jgi:very-short-patch-repair endonuclease